MSDSGLLRGMLHEEEVAEYLGRHPEFFLRHKVLPGLPRGGYQTFCLDRDWDLLPGPGAARPPCRIMGLWSGCGCRLPQRSAWYLRCSWGYCFYCVLIV